MAVGCALGVIAATLTGCGSSQSPSGSIGSGSTPMVTVPAIGGQVTVGIDQAPTGCNPNTASGDTLADHLVLGAVLPSAFSVDPNGDSVYDPALIAQAELQSTTPETVVYTINPKAVWSDGVPITAADFIYAWQHQRSVPITGGGEDADVASTAGYDDIGSMTASDHGRTLTVVFATPYADWQQLFDELLPAHVLERVGWSPACRTVDPRIDLSGGPFEISSVSKRTIVLVRNPKWWGQEPKLDRIVIKVASSPRQLTSWMFRGVINVSAPLYFDPTYLQQVDALPSAKSTAGVSNRFLEMEFSTAAGPTANVDVRQGIAYAIDRQALDDRIVAWANIAIAPSSSHLYAQSQPGYPNTPTPLPANATTTTTTLPTQSGSGHSFPTGASPALEARAMTAGGYVRNSSVVWVDVAGHALSLRVAVDLGDGWAEATALLVMTQLKDQGFDVSAVDEPNATATGQALLNADADLAIIPLSTTPYPTSTSAWYTPLLDLPGETGGQDWSGYESVKVDDLFTQAASELDPVSAQLLYNEIDEQLWADMVALPLFAEPNLLTWSSTVSGVSVVHDETALFSSVFDWARLVSEPASYHGTPKLGAP